MSSLISTQTLQEFLLSENRTPFPCPIEFNPENTCLEEWTLEGVIDFDMSGLLCEVRRYYEASGFVFSDEDSELIFFSSEPAGYIATFSQKDLVLFVSVNALPTDPRDVKIRVEISKEQVFTSVKTLLFISAYKILGYQNVNRYIQYY